MCAALVVVGPNLHRGRLRGIAASSSHKIIPPLSGDNGSLTILLDHTIETHKSEEKKEKWTEKNTVAAVSIVKQSFEKVCILLAV